MKFHSLLPVRHQINLMEASPKDLNTTIKTVQDENMFRYHTEESLDTRVFFDQPRGPCGKATYINAAPKR